MSTHEHRRTPQFTLDVSIDHGPQFGHLITAQVLTRRGGWTVVGTWRWQGLGVPEPLLTDLLTRINAVLTDHLVTRYGVQGELPVLWAGDPDAF
jgi:hypothetical protein